MKTSTDIVDLTDEIDIVEATPVPERITPVVEQSVFLDMWKDDDKTVVGWSKRPPQNKKGLIHYMSTFTWKNRAKIRDEDFANDVPSGKLTHKFEELKGKHK